MPNIYCCECEQETQHKVIMQRCDQEITTLGGKVMQWTLSMSKLISGKHYYEMEPQYYCRYCNHRAIGEQITPPARQYAAFVQ